MSSRKEAAHLTSATLKGLVESTIRNAENVLINLSKNGEPIPNNCANPKKVGDKMLIPVTRMDNQLNAPKSTKGDPSACPHPHALETKLSVSCCRTLTSCEYLPQASARSSYIDYVHGEKKYGTRSQISTGSTKAKIVPGSMRITEIPSITGINIKFSVTLPSANSGAKDIPVSIECPNFQPKRICFNGEWREIIESKNI